MKKQKLYALTAVTVAMALSGCAGNKGAYSGNIQDDKAVEEAAPVAVAEPSSDVVTSGTAGTPVATPVQPAENLTPVPTPAPALPSELPELSFSTTSAAAVAATSGSEGDALLRRRLVYFDYDKSVVRDGDVQVLQAHAQFLSGDRALGVVLSGHADERGSNEYNLALGQRRANAVREILSFYGAGESQMEALSFGEEQPRAQGQTETAWQENRRVEIRYTDE